MVHFEKVQSKIELNIEGLEPCGIKFAHVKRVVDRVGGIESKRCRILTVLARIAGLAQTHNVLFVRRGVRIGREDRLARRFVLAQMFQRLTGVQFEGAVEAGVDDVPIAVGFEQILV